MTKRNAPFVASKFPLDLAKDGNFKMATDLRELSILRENDNGGWVMVHITYTIEKSNRNEAIQRIKAIRNKRYRGGALKWKLFSSSDNENELIESFYEISIDQLTRHQAQVTQYGHELTEKLYGWLKENGGTVNRCNYQEF